MKLVESGKLRIESGKSVYFIIGILILVQAVSAFADSSMQVQKFDYYIKTANTDSVFQDIIKAAEQKGGYFTNYSNNYIYIRIPVQALEEFNAVIKNLAEIDSKNFTSTDISADIERLNAQIESRKKLLETYHGLVKNAPFAELQSVEREMVSLNSQIENLQGRKQAMEKNAALVLISIYAAYVKPLKFRQSDEESPFVWINSTDLNSLRRDF
jgi:hypothetical protein